MPPAPVQELRDLTRTRKQLVREITRHTQRIQKTLEDANVKLTEVVLLDSDILWRPEFESPGAPAPNFCETWLRVAKSVGVPSKIWIKVKVTGGTMSHIREITVNGRTRGLIH